MIPSSPSRLARLVDERPGCLREPPGASALTARRRSRLDPPRRDHPLELEPQEGKARARPSALRPCSGLQAAWLLLAASLVLVAWAPVRAAERGKGADPPDRPLRTASIERHVDSLFARLAPLSPASRRSLLGDADEAMSALLDADRLARCDYAQLQGLLLAAARDSVDVLTLFTLPRMRDKGNLALLLDREQLARLDAEYELHSLFLLSQVSAKGDSTIHMVFLVAGQGKLVIGYDANLTIRHPDYGFSTGKYDYRRLVAMDARLDERGRPGLHDIVCRSEPGEDFTSLRGPMNVAIRSLVLGTGASGERSTIVSYEWFGEQSKISPCPPIELKAVQKARSR